MSVLSLVVHPLRWYKLTIERIRAGQTGLFKEVIGIANEWVTTNDLDEIDHN